MVQSLRLCIRVYPSFVARRRILCAGLRHIPSNSA